VVHTAVVRYVTPGLPVLVEGKWGAAAVRVSAASDSGELDDITYYRTDRPAHVLAGIGSLPANAGGQ
jgi:hypothetical protein